MSVLEATAQVIMGAQTEIALFIIAVCAHGLLFGRYSLLPPASRGKRPHAPKRGAQCTAPGKSRPSRVPESRILQVAESVRQSMQEGASRDALSAQLDEQLRSCPEEAAADMLAGLLESLGTAPTAELLAAVRAALAGRGVRPQGRLLELVLRACLALSLQREFDEVVAGVEDVGSVPVGVALLASRAALQSRGLDGALARMRSFAAQWRASAAQSPTGALPNLLQQLTRLAVTQGRLPAALRELHACGLLRPWVLESALAECMRGGQAASMWAAVEVARSHKVEVTAPAYCTLARGASGDAEVLEIYDAHLQGVDVCADTPAGRRVVEAALRCRRPGVVAQVLAASREVPKQVALLKSFAADGRHEEVMTLFRACPGKGSSLYNLALNACIGCRDMQAFQGIVSEATAAGAADLVTYNTIIKAHLQAQDPKSARRALEAMRAAGFEPNTVTFNELIDASAKTGAHHAWDLVKEMEACGLKPNRVTCSILLKSCQQSSRAAEVERTMALLGSMGEEMDEVLLSSACEACIRVGRADLLRRQLARQRSGGRVQLRGAHAFGSLIRAHGYIGDARGARDTWDEMLAQRVAPTSITIGCMVEALVSNGDTQAGYDLLTGLRLDGETRPLINSVMYGSVLKGFSHQKRFDRAWAVYREMLAERIGCTIATFNALIDACARNGESARIPCLLEEMCSQKVAPNMVTYSTIVKSYCGEGRVEKAFQLVEDMKETAGFEPDEITYNTLLDGCARLGLYERGIAVLDEMQGRGVRPTNFTLSVLAKLASRSRRPLEAFDLCREISQKYEIKFNAHVYNNLIQACASSGDHGRASDTFRQMLGEGVRPDARTYTLLLRGCISTRRKEDAAGFLRAAAGLRGAHPKVAAFGARALQPSGGLGPSVAAEALEGISGQCGDNELALRLFRELAASPNIELDPALPMRLASKASKSRS